MYMLATKIHKASVGPRSACIVGLVESYGVAASQQDRKRFADFYMCVPDVHIVYGRSKLPV